MLFSSVKKLLGWKSWLFWSLANFLSPLSKCYIINQDFFFAHRLEFVGKLPQNVSAVCCIEWFVASLQETLTPSVKQFLIVHRTEVELWWFLLLNIYIQWDFTVRKIRPVNTSFAMVGLKREKKKILPVPFNLLRDICVPFIQGKNSLSFQFWQVLFSVVKNTVLCEKHFVEMVNRVSGTNRNHRVHMLTFYKSWLFFRPTFFVLYFFRHDQDLHLHEFFFSHFGIFLPGGILMVQALQWDSDLPKRVFFKPPAWALIAIKQQRYGHQWQWDAWVFIQLPRNALQPALSSILWQKDCYYTPVISFKGSLGTSAPRCWGVLHEFPPAVLGFLGFGGLAALMINTWVRALCKEKCEFPGLLAGKAGAERSSDNTAYRSSSRDNGSVWHLVPLRLGTASDLGGCICLGDGDVGKEIQCVCPSQNLRLRGGVTPKAQALKPGKRRHQNLGLIKTTEK